MPCDYSKYPDNWFSEIRPRILERAKNRCELCGVDNGQPHPITGAIVVLTIMHMDHDTAHNDASNLKAGCQRCHNKYDAPHRQANARESRRRNRAKKEPALPGMARLI